MYALSSSTIFESAGTLGTLVKGLVMLALMMFPGDKCMVDEEVQPSVRGCMYCGSCLLYDLKVLL
jgi:hypothetical protein